MRLQCVTLGNFERMAYAPMTTEPLQSTGPQPGLLWVAPPARQRRLVTAFRLILAFPHLVIAYFLAIALWVVLIIGWFGALFTGELPRFAREFLAGYLRWASRVGAYLLLLTDSYPPFDFGDDGRHPVRLAIPPAGRLNRLAVFFRLLLVIPAWLVSGFLMYGAVAVMVPVGWLIVLIGGGLPASLHQALAAVLRYLTRFEAYFFMVVPAYPSGVFGDTSVPDTAHPWLLPVGKVAKRLLMLIIALGVAVAVLSSVFDVTSERGRLDADVANSQLVAAYDDLTSQLITAEKAQATCEQGNQQLSCLKTASAVGGIDVPANATGQAQALEQNASAASRILGQLAGAATAEQYQSMYNGSGVTSYLNSVDSGTRQLQQALRNDAT
jgi:uncharacterized protein DUF4389